MATRLSVRERMAKALWDFQETMPRGKPYTWNYLNRHAARGEEGFGDVLKSYFLRADAILRGEFQEQRILFTVAELNSLPVGSVVVDADGWWTYQSDYKGPEVLGQPRVLEWSSSANWWQTDQIELPARLLYIPSATMDAPTKN